MKDKPQWIAVGIVVATMFGLLTVATLVSGDMFLVAEGSDAPSFEAARLSGPDTLSLENFSGKVVLLNIWATNCPPCVEEMPSLQRLHDAMGSDEFSVVAVSTDVIGRSRVLDWVTERDLTFEILHDASGTIDRDYQITGLPETFLIDRNGVIIRKVIGAREWDNEFERGMIQRALDDREQRAKSGGQ